MHSTTENLLSRAFGLVGQLGVVLAAIPVEDLDQHTAELVQIARARQAAVARPVTLATARILRTTAPAEQLSLDTE